MHLSSTRIHLAQPTCTTLTHFSVPTMIYVEMWMNEIKSSSQATFPSYPDQHQVFHPHVESYHTTPRLSFLTGGDSRLHSSSSSSSSSRHLSRDSRGVRRERAQDRSGRVRGCDTSILILLGIALSCSR